MSWVAAAGLSLLLKHAIPAVAPGLARPARLRSIRALPRRVRADLALGRRVVVDPVRADERPILLVFDELLPDPDRDSGSNRMAWLLRLALDLGYDVRFFAVHEGAWFACKPGLGDSDPVRLSRAPAGQLAPAVARPHAAWVARPEVAAAVVHALSAQRLRVVYDTVDLHHRRFERQAALEASRARRAQARLMRSLERRVMRAASTVVAITGEEEQHIRDLVPGADVVVVPNVHPLGRRPPPGRERRADLMFVGSYSHRPNVDAAEILVSEIMPRIWRTMPDVRLSIVGHRFSESVFGDLDERIVVLGWVRDLAAVADRHVALVAPLRFGAGLKGKIGYALSRGLPVVTTTVGAEGFPETRGMVVCDPGAWDELAQRTVDLLADKTAWPRASTWGRELVRREFSPEAVRPLLARALSGG